MLNEDGVFPLCVMRERRYFHAREEIYEASRGRRWAEVSTRQLAKPKADDNVLSNVKSILTQMKRITSTAVRTPSRSISTADTWRVEHVLAYHGGIEADMRVCTNLQS